MLPVPGARDADLQTAVADTEAFELAPSPRRLHVVTPDSECGIPAGPVALGAMIDNRRPSRPDTARDPLALESAG